MKIIYIDDNSKIFQTKKKAIVNNVNFVERYYCSKCKSITTDDCNCKYK